MLLARVLSTYVLTAASGLDCPGTESAGYGFLSLPTNYSGFKSLAATSYARVFLRGKRAGQRMQNHVAWFAIGQPPAGLRWTHMGKIVRAFHSLFLRLLERNEKLPERVGFGALVLIVCGLAGINSILDRQPAPEPEQIR